MLLPLRGQRHDGYRSLNFYVRSAGESLLNDDLTANITSDAAIDGINFWVDIYKNCSPKDSVNYVTLDQAICITRARRPLTLTPVSRFQAYRRTHRIWYSISTARRCRRSTRMTRITARRHRISRS